MANVHDNSMTAHAWAHGNGEARSHNGNMYAQGRTLFSYGPHFPLGVRVDRDNAPPVFFLNSDSYSISTSRHQSETRHAAFGEVHSVPALGAIWRGLSEIADGRGTPSITKEIRRYLESPDVGTRLPRETVATLLRLSGSRASAATVQARAEKAAEREKREKEKRERRAYLEVAKRALTFPLSAYDGTGRALNPEALREYHLRAVPTRMARAWKAAKASGWSEKRLRALRQRERALRGNLERITRRADRERTNAGARRTIAEIRKITGGRPILGTLESGSLSLRIALAPYLRSLFFARATLGVSGARWGELVKYAKELERDALKVQNHVAGRVRDYIDAHAVELWRAGEIPTSQLRYTVRRNGALVRAVNVERDESGAITGGELQTSGGARVPLTHAVRLFRFLKLIRERFEKERPGADGRVEVAWQRNGARARVGSFEVDSVNGDGSFTAGCHFIQWSESRDLAEALGVFDVAPSSDIVKGEQHA